MKKSAIVLTICSLFVLSSCIKEKFGEQVVIAPIEITENSTVTLPNELEEGVLSVGLFVQSSFTVGEQWIIDPATVPAWCTVEPMSGEKGNIVLTFTVAQENGSWVANSANVVIKPLSGASATLPVTQPALNQGTIYVPTAGELGDVLADLGVTSPALLKIVGNIDARDLATINGVSSLENLNLKGAHLPDNDLPAEAFNGNTHLKSIVLPSTLLSIGDMAFYNCTSLAGVFTIPEGVATIGSNSFANCTSLTGMSFPESLTSIGEAAFYFCTGLTGELIIPAGVTTIEQQAFMGCWGVTKLTLSQGVSSIGAGAFSFCSALTAVTAKMPTPVTDLSFFDPNQKLLIDLTVPSGSLAAYEAEWSGFKSYHEL